MSRQCMLYPAADEDVDDGCYLLIEAQRSTVRTHQRPDGLDGGSRTSEPTSLPNTKPARGRVLLRFQIIRRSTNRHLHLIERK